MVGEELENGRAAGRCDVRREGGGWGGGGITLSGGKGGAVGGGVRGVRVLHVRGGKTLVYREIDGGGLVLPEVRSVFFSLSLLPVPATRSSCCTSPSKPQTLNPKP